MASDLPPLRTADVDGPVAYREWDGPPGTTFVLLHGLGGSHLNWVEAAPGLAGLGRVLAPDLPGFGRSPRGARGHGTHGLAGGALGVPRCGRRRTRDRGRELDGRRDRVPRRRGGALEGSGARRDLVGVPVGAGGPAPSARPRDVRALRLAVAGRADRGGPPPSRRPGGRGRVQPPPADRRSRPDPAGRASASRSSCFARHGTTPTSPGPSSKRPDRSSATSAIRPSAGERWTPSGARCS